uniref:Menin n=2 Tax=Drosophila melanogaster TaxID=7227 RepID=Q9VM47_DROME|nr:menin 1, isoform C [Drosophila melanogaster]NP_523498.2 menin 1, isoform A [Drosophila melanogaster]AAF52480.3 menin 1, isoform A [Drosophila melanogaster]ABI31296.1 menin 1, isoform C [Drosophila melanogaster]|eukprot:NP_001036342.1 menin 1, isoform C [Drosophila melanogaster]
MSTITRSASASPMALNGVIDASLFPLKSTADVINLFRRALTSGIEPDLTLLSIVVGYIELSLTTGEAAAQAAQAAAAAVAAGDISQATTGGNDIIMGNSVPFPVVTHELIAGLYKKFQTILSVVEKPKPHRQATREVIKKVSDVIWNSLIRSSYKDRAHLQNLYSYLSGNKLDCFGVALAVVAGCQLLGYKDVRLAISEDHAWVVFGQKRVETIEVTWHGKGSEDKRGQDIRPGIESGSWLYLGGLAVVCERGMEVAAICAALNISLTSNSDCVEVAELQQQLLWLLYDLGHLKRYPMALGTLGELEEIHRTHPSISCEQLYREAIESARTHYRNHHVYPYTYQGNYYNRLLKYRDAFAAWANAADVIRLYTYQCRDDEEIYKELLDIANELIPYVMKTESSGHSARSILRDSEVFANLLRFYDGICQWEEDSLTPILHIGWAKPLVNNITKFDYDIRSQVVIKLPEDLEAEQAKAELARAEQEAKEAKESKEAAGSEAMEGNNNRMATKEEKSKNSELPTTLADLTAACGEKILNPDFLLQGGGQPFADQKQQPSGGESDNPELHNNNNNSNSNNNNNNHNADKKEAAATTTNATTTSNGSGTSVQLPVSSEANNAGQAQSQVQINDQLGKPQHKEAKKEETSDDYDPFEIMLKRPVITLYSQKMKGLKDLLLAEKLNTHAISLQVTAQSVASRKVRGVEKHSATISATITAISSSSGDSVLSGVGGGGGSGSAVTGGASLASSSLGGDSIAASRPKRTRRE